MSSFDSHLRRFAELIHRWNAKINLTGFRTVEEIEDRLLRESALALNVIDIRNKRVLDFGSGAGIPGLVWAICEPSATITSLEIRQKKIAFQKEACRELGIRAEIVAGRFPEAVNGRLFDVVVTRALRFSPELWGNAESLLNPDGILARFGAREATDAGWQSFPISRSSCVMIRARSAS